MTHHSDYVGIEESYATGRQRQRHMIRAWKRKQVERKTCQELRRALQNACMKNAIKQAKLGKFARQFGWDGEFIE